MTRMKNIALVALCITLALSSLLAFTAALQRRDAIPGIAVGTPVTLPEITVKANEVTKDEILWLARVIYSETKQPHEQELVAWVVRNRVETRYRGQDNYRDVVLDPFQFSAFITGTSTRKFYGNLTPESKSPGWKKALEIAERVARADEHLRPFAKETRHFYSEQSMVGGRSPGWARQHRPVKLDRQVDAKRFRFFAGVL